MLNYYFTRNISESEKFVPFQFAHFVYLVIIAGLIIITSFFLRRKTVEKRWEILWKAAWLLPLIYFFRLFMFIYLDREYHISYLQNRLPLELCDLGMFLIPVALMKKNQILSNFLYALSLPGAIVALITPATNYYGEYASFSWQVMWFFIAHGLIVGFVFVSIAVGVFRPNYKSIPKFFSIFLLYAAFVYLINWFVGSNYLYINRPEPGTPTVWFAEWFGTPGFLIPTFLLFLIIVTILYLPWILVDLIKQRKNRYHKSPNKKM